MISIAKFKYAWQVLPAAILIALCAAAALNAQVSQSGPLRVGAAKVDVTPSASELPPSYLGVLDRVYSRAIVVDNGHSMAALITVDVLAMPDLIWKRVTTRISDELGIPVKNIILAGTGTHSSPMGKPTGGAPFSMDPGPSFDEKLVASVREAKQKLQPARLSWGKGLSYINVQRDGIDPKTHLWAEGAYYDGVSDKTVAVLKFVSTSGEPIAVYYNYAVFSVITGVLDQVSGDITGAASRYIEKSLDDKAIAVFALGAHGDQNPVYFQQTFDLRQLRIRDYAKRGVDISNATMPPPGGTGLDRNNPEVVKLMDQQRQMILSMGQMLGEEVLHAMRNSSREESSIEIFGNQKTVSCPGRLRTNQGRGGVAGTYKDADPVEIRLGLLMIGDVAIGSVNGNPYSAVGLRLKAESPYAKTMLVTKANGMSAGAYMPDDASYGHETFEVLNTALKPGCAETSVIDGIFDMMPPIMY